MVCQECKLRPSTLHFTKIVNGEKTEVHICEHCAQEKGYSSFFSPAHSNFSFNNLLAGLLNMEQPLLGQKTETFSENEVLECPQCHMTYQQFTKLGRFGCSSCYEVFQSQLSPILRKLHGGNTAHAGKIPKRMGGNLHLRKELDDLKLQLQQLILQEEFESAAQIRDKIRSIEKQLSERRREE